MDLKQILQALQARSLDRDQATELARLGFLEWLWLLPANCDVAREAKAAYERSRPLCGTAPAIAVLCDLLMQATQPLATPVRRGGARGRRLLH